MGCLAKTKALISVIGYRDFCLVYATSCIPAGCMGMSNVLSPKSRKLRNFFTWFTSCFETIVNLDPKLKPPLYNKDMPHHWGV